MTDEKPRETLRMPLKNFRPLGELPPERSEWWRAFGRALDQFHRDYERVK